MIREPRSSSLVSSKLLIPAKRSDSATRTSLKTMSAFCTVRSAILFSILLRLTPGQGRVHDEAADAAVGLVPGPHQHVVAERPVADPALGAVEHPGVPAVGRPAGNTPCDGLHAAGHVGAVLRFGQGERAGGPEAGGVLEQARLLLLGAEAVERFDEEVVVDQEERRQRGVHAGHLGDDQPGEQVAVAALGRGAELQGRELGQDVRGELRLVPPLAGERCDLAGEEHPQLGQLGLLTGVEHRLEVEEIGGRQPRDGIRGAGEGASPACIISVPSGWRRQGGWSRR